MRNTIVITLATALAGCQGGTSVGDKQEGFTIPAPWLAAQINIENKHDALGFCGDPVGDLTASAGGGYVQRYQNCDITDRVGPGGGTFEVHGAIRDAWHRFASESGWFGYPLTDETDGLFGGGRMSVFEHGFITWNASTGIGLFPNTPPPSRAFDSGQINLGNGVPGNGNCQLGVAANGDWEFRGHAHDSGFPDYQYSIGASINWIDGQGQRHAKYVTADGTVQGSVHFIGGDRDSDVHLSGNDPEIAANWPAIAQNGWMQSSLHMSADGGGIFDAVITDIAVPAVAAVFAIASGSPGSGPSSPDGGFTCRITGVDNRGDATNIYYQCDQ